MTPDIREIREAKAAYENTKRRVFEANIDSVFILEFPIDHTHGTFTGDSYSSCKREYIAFIKNRDKYKARIVEATPYSSQNIFYNENNKGYETRIMEYDDYDFSVFGEYVTQIVDKETLQPYIHDALFKDTAVKRTGLFRISAEDFNSNNRPWRNSEEYKHLFDDEH